MGFGRNFIKYSFIFLLLCVAYKYGNAQPGLIESNYPYISPTPGKISIVALSAIPEGRKVVKNDFIQLVECGFNVGRVSGDLEYLNYQFNLIKELDLKLMVRNSDFNSDYYKKLISELKNNPQLGVWMLSDEPSYENLERTADDYERIYNLDPDHVIYVNLVGADIKYFTGDCENYWDYIKLVQKYLKPSFWSYDLYPFSTVNGKLSVNYDLFYSDFELFKKISEETSRPFWAFCQSMQFKNSVVSRPAPKEEYLRFEAFSALAYGAQGIVYWTYALRPSNEYETYYTALIDLDGNKTKYWYGAQKVNDEIKKFNDVFCECNVQEVRHTGSILYKDTQKLTEAIGPFNRIISGDAGVLVSRITNKDNNFIVIVNHDAENSQKISLFTKQNQKIYELTSLVKRNFTGSIQKVDFTLPKGGYAIFSYD